MQKWKELKWLVSPLLYCFGLVMILFTLPGSIHNPISLSVKLFPIVYGAYCFVGAGFLMNHSHPRTMVVIGSSLIVLHAMYALVTSSLFFVQHLEGNGLLVARYFVDTCPKLVEALAFMGLIRWGFTHNRRRTIPTLFYSFVVLIIVFSLSSLVNFVFSWQIDIFENTADPMNQYRQLGRFVGTIFMLCALCISIYHQKIEAHLTKS